MKVVEDICAIIAGGACVAGISLSQINQVLTTVSLSLSILAAMLAIGIHIRRAHSERRRKDDP